MAARESSVRRVSGFVLVAFSDKWPLAQLLPLSSLSQVSELGRGFRDRGRGFVKGAISVPVRASGRQKEPSVTPDFNELWVSGLLSRQRSTRLIFVKGSCPKQRVQDCVKVLLFAPPVESHS
jgi:hypothetical protein